MCPLGKESHRIIKGALFLCSSIFEVNINTRCYRFHTKIGLISIRFGSCLKPTGFWLYLLKCIGNPIHVEPKQRGSEVFILYFFRLLFACSNFFQFFPEYPDACTRTTAKGYNAVFVHDKNICLWSGIRDIFAHISLYHFKICINQVRVRDVYPLNKLSGLIGIA